MKFNLDEKILQEIISAAQKNNVKKIFLFGSRARGNNHERSDIDLAVSGGDFLNFADDVENIETLLSFDVVNLDEKISADLKNEIERDGILIFEEVSPLIKKFDSFVKSLAVLKISSHDESKQSEIYRMGVIGQFNLTFELSWKALRETLIFHGVSDATSGSPREIIKLGYKFNFINDAEIWIDMLKCRNLSIHIYSDEKIVDELVTKIFDKFISAFVALQDELNARNNF